MNAKTAWMPLETILAETKPRKFIDDLGDFATDPNIGGMTPLDLETAPPLVKGMIFVNAFYLTTFSSGIGMWFEESYDDYADLDKFFDKIEAANAAGYFRAGKALFPNGHVPEDADARGDFIDEHEMKFRAVDRKFKSKNASEEAILKFREYVIGHQKAFESEAKAYWEIRKSNRSKWRKKIEKYR